MPQYSKWHLYFHRPLKYFSSENCSNNTEDTQRHLVHVVLADDGVETRVEVVEQVDYLDGLADGRDSGEAHDVAEVQRHFGEVLRLHRLPCLESLSHRPDSGARAQEEMDLRGTHIMEIQAKEPNLKEKSGMNQVRAQCYRVLSVGQ